MNKKEFKTFCRKEFESRGFKKYNKMFYLSGKDVLCGLLIDKSDYSDSYYINYYFFIGEFNNPNEYPTRYDHDIYGRISVLSKTQTYKGKPCLTAIEYEEYNEEELRPYFEKKFEEVILPAIYHGKKYILDNLGKLYFLYLRKEEVMQKLMS